MTDDIIKLCGCFATETCDHYERPGVLKYCPSCASFQSKLDQEKLAIAIAWALPKYKSVEPSPIKLADAIIAYFKES